MGKLKKIIIITGPTAVGKTDLAIFLAQKLNGEIISADSMQIYKKMDIGTAKPTPTQRKKVPHHLIDFVDPRESYSAGDFQRDARQLIEEIFKRKNLPLVVGGTGLYIKSLIHGLPPAFDKKDPNLRNELREIAQREGKETLHKKLKQCDPALASRIHPNDIQRVIRGLEVFKLTGKPLSEHQKNAPTSKLPYENVGFILFKPRDELYESIDQRVDKMEKLGLEDEVKELIEMGCNLTHTSMQGLGYKEFFLHLKGFLEREEAINQIKTNTRRYAKRQFTWFRNQFDFPWVQVGERENFFSEVLEQAKKQLTPGKN